MAVYKRKGKSKFYWTRFMFDGREIRQSTKTANKRKAEEFEDDLRYQLKQGKIGVHQLSNSTKALTFKDAMRSFLDNLTTKESTKKRYETASKALIAFFGNAIVNTIDADDVKRFRTERQKQNKLAPARLLKKDKDARLDKTIKPATVNRELVLLKSLFNSLVIDRKLTWNPAKGVKLLTNEEKATERKYQVISDADFKAYLMACSQPLRDVAVLVYETGMRPSEIFNLRKEHIDFAEGYIRVEGGKTKAARRNLAMSERVASILQARINSASGDLLFAGGKKGDKETPIVKLTNSHLAAIDRVNKARKESGAATLKPFRLYDLRHSFATHLTQSGVDLMTTAAILGHSGLRLLDRYAHPSDQHKANAMVRLEEFRGQKSNVKAFRRSA